MSKAVTSAAPAFSVRRLQWMLMGTAMTLAVLTLPAWSQPASAPGLGERAPGTSTSPRVERAPAMGEMHGRGEMHGGGDMHGRGGMHGWGDHHRMSGMHHGMGGGMMFRGSPERMGRMLDHMLDGLNATDAQRSQIKQIAAAAAADLRAQGEAGRALRQRAMQAFTAPTIDAAAVEQTRQQMLQQHDRMSRRASQAMLDAARVLTPEQRARLGERMRDRQARMEDRMKRMEAVRQPTPPR